jgi:hypothetical protein
MAKASSKAPITTRALVQRINRKLAPKFEQVRKIREPRAPYTEAWGEFFNVDFNRNVVLETSVDLEDLGRELRVLRPWEVLK